MKRLFTVISVLLAIVAGLNAQNYSVLDEIAAVPERANGYNYVQYFQHGQLTKAPAGYKPFYIGHYARHGARYAWEDVYIRIDTLLHKAGDAGALTEYGKDFLSRLDALIPLTRGRVGELTPAGWEQHRHIARNLMNDFPEVFKSKPTVRAIASPVNRCIMSMASACMEIARKYPGLDIYEDMSETLLPEVVPTNRNNPFPAHYGRVAPAFPGGYSPVDKEELAGRIVSDLSLFDSRYSVSDFVWDVYTLGVGMDSVDIDIRFDDFFADRQEKTGYWIAQNVDAFNSGYSNRYLFYPVAQSFVRRADECIASGGTAVDMRFGHDSVVEPLLVLLNIGGSGHVADKPEDQMYWFRNFDVCMAANIVFVLYRDRKGSDVLFKLLLNGEETTLPDLTPVNGPYYRWNDFRDYVEAIGVKAAETIRR